MRKLLMLVGILLLNACTSEQVYESVQTSQRNECEKLQLSQREDCLKRLAPDDYREYQRKRQELEKK